METFEHWEPRGIGMDWVPCLLTGAESTCRPNISGFVDGREGGLRVVEMFGGPKYARLDYRDFEPNWVQVKVGVDKGNEDVLQRLAVACADGYITDSRLAWAKDPATHRGDEPLVVRAVRLGNAERQYGEMAKKVQSLYDKYDIEHRGIDHLLTYATNDKYGATLQTGAFILDRMVREANAYGKAFWDWFCARNPELDGRAPAQVFPEDPTRVYNVAETYFKKEEK